jgi:hypothetical protein
MTSACAGTRSRPESLPGPRRGSVSACARTTLLALTAAESAGVGQPVTGRAVVQPLLGQVSRRRPRRPRRPTAANAEVSPGPGRRRRPARRPSADHRTSASPRTATTRRPTPLKGRVGSEVEIDIGISNQGPPTFQPISTGFIPRSEIIHRK